MEEEIGVEGVEQGTEPQVKIDVEPEEAANYEESFEVVDSPLEFSKDEGPLIASFKDHFTLQIPSSTVRYRERHSAARVLEGPNSQFVLEETYDDDTGKHNIEVRKIHDTSEGVRFLRLSYALVTAFWTGFLFVFCLQILLFLVLDLAIESGATTHQESNWGSALGAILAFPSFVYGLSSALVIAGAYIVDTYKGHYLIRNFTFRAVNPVTVEWLFFSFFLGLPVFVMSVTLLSGTDQWWKISLLFWFSCILAFFVLFCFNVIWYEIRAAWLIIKNRYSQDNDFFLCVLGRCILLRQIATYSGHKMVTYLSRGAIVDSEYTDKSTRTNMIPETYEERILWRGKLTLWERLSCIYDNLEGNEERIYTIDDARDVRPYVTSHTWNLEKIFCRPKNSRYIAIVRGPGAVSEAQMKSSMACSIIGTFLIYFLMLSLLLYLGAGIVFTMFIVAIGVIIAIPTLQSTYRLYQTANLYGIVKLKILEQGENMQAEEEEDERVTGTDAERETSEAVYLVQENYRISRPKTYFCWIMFFLEVSLLFIYPFWSLYAVGNYPLATLFIFVAGISGIRYYINAAIVLEETGHMDHVGGRTEQEKWKRQSRLNEIVGNITRGRSRGAWMAVIGFFGFAFLALFLGAIGSDVDNLATFDAPYHYTSKFEYVQKDSLRYPTCQLTAGASEDSPLKSMADFAFLAGLAYRGVNVTQRELNGWFGDEVAMNENDVVSAWQEEVKSAVSFKLVTFPSSGNFAYVLIRGTTNNWDMLTDAQLWSAAFLMQGLREILPIGIIWTPVIPELINVITKMESQSINRVSFYRDTTAFVEFLKEQVNSTYAGLGVTGHSLGGGLSIITGAQTGVPAVALSGPNAMLSRKTFIPPVSPNDLDTYTFNIIPERDVVPMIDDRAQNYQQINCETDLTDVIGCHDSTRSLCEIIYKCGTGDRPFLCECVTLFNYPMPKPKGNSTLDDFAQECGIESS